MRYSHTPCAVSLLSPSPVTTGAGALLLVLLTPASSSRQGQTVACWSQEHIHSDGSYSQVSLTRNEIHGSVNQDSSLICSLNWSVYQLIEIFTII